MAVDPNIILSAKTFAPDFTGSIQAGQQVAQNQQSLAAGAQKQQITALQIQQEQQDQSDNQKLTQATQGLDPNDPDYGTKLVSAAKDAGVSGKALIYLQQNQLKQRSENLTQENQQLTLKENYLKLDATKKAAYDQQLDGALGDMGDIQKAYDKSGGNVPYMTTLITSHIKDEVDTGKITQQQGQQVLAKVTPNGKFHYSVFKPAYEQTQAAAKARDAAKEESETKLNEAKAREQDALAQKAKAVATGQEYSPEGRALFDAVVSKDPSGLRGLSGKDRVMYFNDNAKSGMTADEIINARNQTKAVGAEATSLGKQKAALEKNETAITVSKPGKPSLLDQAGARINQMDYSALKKAGNFDQWTQEQSNDPKFAGYKIAIQDLRSEYSTVIAKGGQSTDSTRAEAAHMIPDIITPAMFVEIRKQIMQGIATNKGAIEDSIANLGKSSSESSASSEIPSGWSVKEH